MAVVVVAGSSVSGVCVCSVDVTPPDTGPEWRRSGPKFLLGSFCFEVLLVKKLGYVYSDVSMLLNQINHIKRIPFFKNNVFIFHFQYSILKKQRHCTTTTFTLMIKKTPYFMFEKIRILPSYPHLKLMENVSRNAFTT